MDAHVPRLLSRAAKARVGIALAALAGVTACGSAPRRLPEAAAVPPLPVPQIVVPLPQEPRQVQHYGPEVLLPDPAAEDKEVARIGDRVLRRSQAFARLLEADPKLAFSAVDLLVFDVLVADHAQQFLITLRPERVRELVDQEEQQLAASVQRELGEQMTFAEYVFRIFGLPLDAWRRGLELRTAQRLFQGYVIRYLARREDRVQVRYIVHKDRAVLEEAAGKVRAGADFATLALRLSEDELRREGGLLPAFGSGFPHAVTEQALKLGPGAQSPVFAHTSATGVERFYLVYCLQRLPGRAVTFEQVRDEIDRDLALRPLSPIETNAYTLRWRAVAEAKDDNLSPVR